MNKIFLLQLILGLPGCALLDSTTDAAAARIGAQAASSKVDAPLPPVSLQPAVRARRSVARFRLGQRKAAAGSPAAVPVLMRDYDVI